MKASLFRYFFVGGLFLLILCFFSLITNHPGIAVRLTSASFILFITGSGFYIAFSLNEKQK